MIVAKTITPTEEQSAAREAVAMALREAADQVLDDWTDDRLLGQLRARTIIQVKRAARVRVGRANPELLARVTSWRIARLLDEVVPGAVSRAQGRALQQRYANEEPSESFPEFEIGEPINGVTVIGIKFTPIEDDPQDTVCSADE